MDQCASLLMTGLGYAGAAAQKSRLASASAEDWRCVLDLARRQNVSAFLYHRLQATGVLPPAAVRDELKKDYLILSMRNARLYSALSGVLELLHHLRIDVIALKGVYLAEVVYGNVGVRGMNDIDLLVKKEDLPRVEKALTESGAVPDNPNRVITEETHHFGYKLPGSGLRVEIHWTLLSVQGLENDIDGLWKRSQPAVIAGVSARTLSPEDLLLHLCAHTAAHTYALHVRMLCDIGEVLRYNTADLNWDDLARRAGDWGVRRAVYLVLRLTGDLLHAAIPAEPLAAMRPDDDAESYLNQLQEHIFAGDEVKIHMGKSAGVARLWSRERPGALLRFLRDRLFLPRKTMSLIYPAPADSWRIFLYYPVRVRDVLRRHGKTAWRTARGDCQARTAAAETNRITKLKDWLLSG